MALTFQVGPANGGMGIIVYVLAASIVIPASGWIAGRFEARRVFVLAIGTFTLASALCGISASLSAFVAARALQGVGGALMSAVGQLILVRSVERARLLRVHNISPAPMLVAPVLGPPLGGLITQWLGWPWIFYLNVPIGIVGMVVAWRILSAVPIQRRPFDHAGFALNAATLIFLLFGLSELGGNSVPREWAVAGIVAALASGGLGVRHLLRAAHPLISLEPFRFPTFRAAVGTALPFVRLPIGALPFALPILLQVGFHFSALRSGLVLLAHAAGDLGMKLFMERAFGRFGYRPILVLSAALTAIGIGACALLDAQTPLALMLLLLWASGCTRSFLMTGLNTLSYAEVPAGLAASAVTLNQIFMQVATAVSVSVATVCFDLSIHLRGGVPGHIAVVDCRVALVALGVLGLFALPPLMRLPHHAGHQLSGRAAPAGED
jgi:EmrB/QacA subfamily drug resistance transporter